MRPDETSQEAAGGIARRAFVRTLVGTGLGATAAAILYPVVRFVIPPPVAESTETSVVAAATDELVPNSGKVFKFGNKPGILIRTPAGELRAFTAICTHLQCTVQYREDYQHIWCACHNGHFDLHGKNIAGPPPRPLEAYAVNVRGNEVVVSRL